MKKIKSPWYGIGWIALWTVALGWFLSSGSFNQRESIGLIAVWAVLVGVTVYVIYRFVKVHGWSWVTEKPKTPTKIVLPALNAPCPCGSGKKYKRCCGA